MQVLAKLKYDFNILWQKRWCGYKPKFNSRTLDSQTRQILCNRVRFTSLALAGRLKVVY